MSEAIEKRIGLARLAYQDAGREISQAFDVMNSNTTLAAGVLAALLAVLGAGELFAQGDPIAGTSSQAFPRLSAVSLVVLAAATPLIARFFVRSMTAYQNLLRFLDIQKTAWKYVTGRISWDAFDFHMELFLLRWRTPKPMSRVVFENLKYGFMWIAIVYVVALVWAFWSVDDPWARLIAAGFLVAGFTWELWTLAGYRMRYWQLPTKAEEFRLQRLNALGPGRSSSGRWSDHLLEEVTGLFLGRRRLFKRRR